MSPAPRVWLLLGRRRGDNNQVLALGEALGVPFETRTIRYRRSARLWMNLFPQGLHHVTSDSKAWLRPPWPDVVIGIGRRSVPVARWIQRQNGGRTQIVRLGHPRAPNGLFDLILTTRQYPVLDGDNVVRLPLALNRFRKPPMATAEEADWLGRWPRPHLLLSLGGTAPMWRLDLGALEDALGVLARRAREAGGTLFVVSSPRTPPDALTLVRNSDGAVLADHHVRFAVALADADEQFVTADSVSMISEAVMSGKPVGLIPVAMDARGQRILGPDPETSGVRDIRRFWRWVEDEGLAGTATAPKRGQFEEPAAIAVRAIRDRLGGLLG